tara:strand:+ start:17517 stop:18062 length:546 start_codon:yes stop_codon:yes gene_type:complete
LATIFNSPNAISQEANTIPEQGKAIIQSFSFNLKAALQNAIKEGSLKNSITACSQKSPEIAEKYSNSGWQIKRTSLKIRNAENKPSEFERNILLQFQAKKNEGLPISDLNFYKAEITENGKTHHLMKAISTQALCLGCHGGNLSEEVQSELKLHYPDDQAIGFQEGDIRGAFSLVYIEDND